MEAEGCSKAGTPSLDLLRGAQPCERSIAAVNRLWNTFRFSILCNTEILCLKGAICSCPSADFHIGGLLGRAGVDKMPSGSGAGLSWPGSPGTAPLPAHSEGLPEQSWAFRSLFTSCRAARSFRQRLCTSSQPTGLSSASAQRGAPQSGQAARGTNPSDLWIYI